MKFKSIDQLVDYVKSAQNQATVPIAAETKKIAVKVTTKEVGTVSQRSGRNNIYEPTGDIFRCIETNVTLNLITLVWRDNGGWESVFGDKDNHPHMYAPWALENGMVWDKGTNLSTDNYVYKDATEFVKKTDEERRQKIPKVYLSFMRGNGIPIKRVK